MKSPRVILSRGPIYNPGAIVIDYARGCFWRGHEARPWGGSAASYKLRFRLTAGLIVRSPHMISHDELVDLLWSDDPAGGPDNAVDYLRVVISQTRPLHKWLGGYVRNYHGRGYAWEFLDRVFSVRSAA